MHNFLTTWLQFAQSCQTLTERETVHGCNNTSLCSMFYSHADSGADTAGPWTAPQLSSPIANVCSFSLESFSFFLFKHTPTNGVKNVPQEIKKRSYSNWY